MTRSKQKSANVRVPKSSSLDTNSEQALPKDDRSSDRESSFLLAQYSSLREEILKRVEIQHQIILGTLIAVGTILTVSTQDGSSSILLIYPFLALFLSLAWSQNDYRNRQITEHLSSNEKLFLTDLSLGWEHSRTSSRLWIFGSRKVFAARGIFVGSQVLTLLLFWLRSGTANQAINPEDSILLIVGIIIILTTLLIIGFPSRKPLTRQKR